MNIFWEEPLGINVKLTSKNKNDTKPFYGCSKIFEKWLHISGIYSVGSKRGAIWIWLWYNINGFHDQWSVHNAIARFIKTVDIYRKSKLNFFSETPSVYKNTIVIIDNNWYPRVTNMWKPLYICRMCFITRCNKSFSLVSVYLKFKNIKYSCGWWPLRRRPVERIRINDERNL